MLKLSDIPKDRLLEFLKPGVELFPLYGGSSYIIESIDQHCPRCIFWAGHNIFGHLDDSFWFPYWGIKIEIEGLEI